MRKLVLRVNLPFLRKGAIYAFDDEIGHIYRCGEDGEPFEFPLRVGLSGYLWLLLTERDKYFTSIHSRTV